MANPFAIMEPNSGKNPTASHFDPNLVPQPARVSDQNGDATAPFPKGIPDWIDSSSIKKEALDQVILSREFSNETKGGAQKLFANFKQLQEQFSNNVRIAGKLRSLLDEGKPAKSLLVGAKLRPVATPDFQKFSEEFERSKLEFSLKATAKLHDYLLQSLHVIENEIQKQPLDLANFEAKSSVILTQINKLYGPELASFATQAWADQCAKDFKSLVRDSAIASEVARLTAPPPKQKTQPKSAVQQQAVVEKLGQLNLETVIHKVLDLRIGKANSSLPQSTPKPKQRTPRDRSGPREPSPGSPTPASARQRNVVTKPPSPAPKNLKKPPSPKAQE
jgi:heme oxygenase